jgi:hypothetical protein
MTGCNIFTTPQPLIGHFFTVRATEALISCIQVLPFQCATMYYTRPTEPTDQGQHVASDTVLYYS